VDGFATIGAGRRRDDLLGYGGRDLILRLFSC
jgi:hypothetical protein